MPKNWFKEARNEIFKKTYLRTSANTQLMLQLNEDGDLELNLREYEGGGMFSRSTKVSETTVTLSEEATMALVKELLKRMGMIAKGDDWDTIKENLYKDLEATPKEDSQAPHITSIFQMLQRRPNDE